MPVLLMALVVLGLGAVILRPGPTAPRSRAPHATPVPSRLTLAGARLTLPVPHGWGAVETPDGTSITFEPPGSAPSQEAPNMSVTYLPGVTYRATLFPPQSSTPARISVGGIAGWESDGQGILPPQNHYVVVPLHAGVLFAVAYRDSSVSLATDLDALLRGGHWAPGVTP